MDISHYNSFKDEISGFYARIRKLKSKQIQKKHDKEKGKIIVKRYFSEIRPKISPLKKAPDWLNSLDMKFQKLLSLTNANSLRSKYLSTAKAIKKELDQVETQVISLEPVKQTLSSEFSNFEKLVLSTIEKLSYSASLSYRQALLDMRDGSRVSYKGTANEIRETLREILSHLAPDEKVKSQEGFRLEKNRDKPTQKQKVSFILKQRNKSKAHIKVPVEAIEVIEKKGDFTRAIYDRASRSAHGQSKKEEIMRLKRYLDSVLSELLELPESF